MAVKWSWAWGPETAVELEVMGWDWQSTDPTYGAPRTDIVYTYPGSPSRYSWGQDDQYLQTTFVLPEETFVPEGWICVPFYANGTSGTNRCIEIRGAGTGDSIWIAGTSTDGIWELKIDNTFKGNFTLVQGDWNYLAMKYTMANTEWGCEVFVNGLSVASGSKSNVAETLGEFKMNGNINGTRDAIYGQFVVWDSLSDAGHVPMYVTRVNPSVDTAAPGAGVWTPSVGSDNFAVLSGTFDESTFTSNTGSATGDKVVCQVTGALGLITQLGTTPDSISGITVHCWASGSGQNGFTALSDNNSTYTSGTHITPEINDPTYCFSTDALQPSGPAWNATSSLYIKYEVS